MALNDALAGLSLDDFLDGGEQTTEQSALKAVSMDIARDLVEVIALCGSQLLSGRDEKRVVDQFQEGVNSLMRLAEAAEDQAHIDLLQELGDGLAVFRASGGRSGPRHNFLNLLRDWLPVYGRFLGGDSQGRLVKMVEFDRDAAPLFVELANLRGIGPRRLRRLHGAGFYQAAVLSEADPAELAAVTGLPLKLASEVVLHSKAWLAEQRRKAIVDMNRRLREFQEAVALVEASGQAELQGAAQQALLSMKKLLSDMEGTQ